MNARIGCQWHFQFCKWEVLAIMTEKQTLEFVLLFTVNAKIICHMSHMTIKNKVNNFTHFIHLGDACTLYGMGWCEFPNYPIVISLANDFRIFVWIHNYNDFPKWISKIRWLHIKCRCNRRMSLAATIDCIRLAVTLSGNNW